MRLYACHTPSHQPLVDKHFLESLPKEFRGRNLVLRKLRQRSKTGLFASAGFQETCVEKIAFLVEACRTEKHPFLFTDVDIRFYARGVAKDLEDMLGGHDMLFQWDGPSSALCTGFIAIRPSAKVTAFWERVLAHMKQHHMLDQDATNGLLAKRDPAMTTVRIGQLPPRYWTFGRHDHHWVPGLPVDPPDDLVMHHGNWTKGLKHKLALLEAVRVEMEARRRKEAEKPQHMIERNPIGATASMAKLLDLQRSQIRAKHHPMPLALVLQFWRKDERRALELARLLADLEPEFRDDVGFFFARQTNVPKAEENKNLWDTMLYVGKKFPVTELETEVNEAKPYPGVCFDPFASALDKLAEAYYSGRMPYGRAFMFEADGCPIGIDWVDRLKRAHEETLITGKRVTGPLMRFGGVDRLHSPGGHINGTMLLELSFWVDHPSIHRCTPADAWDVFGGPVYRMEAGTTSPNIIRNEHGALGLSESLYWIFGKETCWLTSCKDQLPFHWCRKYVNQIMEARG